MTERIRSQMAGHSLRDRVRSLITREELRVEQLLLHIEKSQLMGLRHLFWMPPEHVPLVRNPEEDLGPPGGIMSPGWPGNTSREREVWASLHRLLPPQPRSWMDNL